MDLNSDQESLLKWGGGGAVATSGVVVFAIPTYGYYIAAAILLLVLGFLCALYLIAKRKEKQRDEEVTSAVTADVSRERSNESVRIQKQFLSGMEEYKELLKNSKEKDKSLYRVPWYLVVGPSGCGKTQMLSQSGLEWPLLRRKAKGATDLKQFLEGEGGTRGMKWWFGKRAVLLDTAGRLMLPEGEQNPAWDEFLEQLKRSRPNIPINGMVLCISAEILSHSNPTVWQSEARQVAAALEGVVATLDIRFPIYVLVTKCDLIVGFREFFGKLDRPEDVNQIFGWSEWGGREKEGEDESETSPNTLSQLDQGFNPRRMGDYLAKIGEELRRYRLAFLTNPMARGGKDARRTDEVDLLFAFPNEFAHLGERLENYLRIAFGSQANEGEEEEDSLYSLKRPFMRGVYFTSAKQKGTPLDEELERILGQPVRDQESDARDQRAYFLTSLFERKIFKEKGLVTAATNIRELVRNRYLIYGGCAAAAVVLLLLFSWLGYAQLRSSVAAESRLWTEAKNSLDRKDGKIGVLVEHNGELTYNLTNPAPGQVGLTVADYHLRLRNLAQTPPSVSWVFRPITWVRPARDLDRVGAQQAVIEKGVLAPLVDPVRRRMTGEMGRAKQPELHTPALKALIRLELDYGKSPRQLSAGTSKMMLEDWANYLAGGRIFRDTNLIHAFDWTYAPTGGKKIWPPAGLSGGNSLANNPPINAGLESFIASAKADQRLVDESLKDLEEIVTTAREYHQAETNFFYFIENRGASGDDHRQRLASLSQTKEKLDRVLAPRGSRVTVAQGKGVAAAFESLRKSAQASSKEAVASLAQTSEAGAGQLPLSREIMFKLAGFQADTEKRVEVAWRAVTNEVTDLDANLILPYNTFRSYAYRHSLYQRSLGSAVLDFGTASLLGQKWGPVVAANLQIQPVKQQLDTYSGQHLERVKKTCDVLREVSEHQTFALYRDQYQREVDSAVRTGTFDAPRLKFLKERLFDKFELDHRERLQLPPSNHKQLDDLAAHLAGERKRLGGRYRDERLSQLTIPDVGVVEVTHLKQLRDLGENLRRELDTAEVHYFVADYRPDLDRALADAYARRADAFVRSRLLTLQSAAKFPLISDSEDVISNADIARLREDKAAFDKAHAEGILTAYPANRMDRLKRKYDQLAAILAVVTDNQGRPGKFTLNIRYPDKNKNVASALRGFRVFADEGRSGVPVDITKGGDEGTRFRDLPLGEPLQLEFRYFATDANAVLVAPWPPWSALKWLKIAGQPVSADRRKWEIPLPLDFKDLSGADRKETLRIELEFVNGLPLEADWPTKSKLDEL